MNIIKSLLAALIVIVCITQANAQSVMEKDVPSNIRQAMKKMFPSASSVVWSQDVPGFVNADFTQDKKKMSVIFDGNAGWVSTNSYYKKEEYPAVVTGYVNSNFSGAKISSIALSESAKEKTYECRIKYNGEQYELIFDMDGNLKMKSRVED